MNVTRSPRAASWARSPRPPRRPRPRLPLRPPACFFVVRAGASPQPAHRRVVAQRAKQPRGELGILSLGILRARGRGGRLGFFRLEASRALASHVPVRARALALDAVHARFAVRARAALRALPGDAPVRTPHALGAVLLELPMRARVALGALRRAPRGHPAHRLHRRTSGARRAARVCRRLRVALRQHRTACRRSGARRGSTKSGTGCIRSWRCRAGTASTSRIAA